MGIKRDELTEAHWCDLPERYRKWKTMCIGVSVAGAMPVSGSGCSRL
jgi:hypothetical protein